MRVARPSRAHVAGFFEPPHGMVVVDDEALLLLRMLDELDGQLVEGNRTTQRRAGFWIIHRRHRYEAEHGIRLDRQVADRLVAAPVFVDDPLERGRCSFPSVLDESLAETCIDATEPERSLGVDVGYGGPIGCGESSSIRGGSVTQPGLVDDLRLTSVVGPLEGDGSPADVSALIFLVHVVCLHELGACVF